MIVSVVTNGASTVMVVTVVVICAARLLAALSALCIADPGIGAPAMSHIHWRGVNRRLSSILLSQLLCIQLITSGKKVPPDS